MMEQLAKRPTSEDEYLELERRSETKHELVKGVVIAMSRVTYRHNTIAANVAGTLHALLAGSPCRAVGSGQRIHVPATGLYTYPDVSVVCGGSEFHPKDRDTLLNPRVLVEVLSEPTEGYDRAANFPHYRNLPSLVSYLRVAQHEPHVEHYRRLENGQWLLTDHRGVSSPVELTALRCELPLEKIYESVQFEPSA